MKLRHLIALGVAGCTGYAAYHVYKTATNLKQKSQKLMTLAKEFQLISQKFVAALTTLTTSFQHFKQSDKIWITNVAFLNKKLIAA